MSLRPLASRHAPSRRQERTVRECRFQPPPQLMAAPLGPCRPVVAAGGALRHSLPTREASGIQTAHGNSQGRHQGFLSGMGVGVNQSAVILPPKPEKSQDLVHFILNVPLVKTFPECSSEIRCEGDANLGVIPSCLVAGDATPFPPSPLSLSPLLSFLSLFTPLFLPLSPSIQSRQDEVVSAVEHLTTGSPALLSPDAS